MQAEVNGLEEAERVSGKTTKGWDGNVIFDSAGYEGGNSKGDADRNG